MTKKPEIVNIKDIVRSPDGLYYKENAKVPFTGVYEDGHLKVTIKNIL